MRQSSKLSSIKHSVIKMKWRLNPQLCLEISILKFKKGQLSESNKHFHHLEHNDKTTRVKEERWSHPPTYWLGYGTTRTGTGYHQEMQQAHHAYLEAAARLEDQWNKQRRDAAEREWLEHQAATQRWEAQMREAGYLPTHRIPAGPPPVAIQTDAQPRALPQVHAALRSNDPKAPTSQLVVAKKPPPTTGKPLPKGFHRGDAAPPMIGTAGPVQLPPPVVLPTATPTTPAHPPRPPLEAIPKPAEAAPAPPTLKHALPQPAPEGHPTEQIRAKEFPRGADGNPCVAPPAIDLSSVGAPIQKALQEQWFLPRLKHHLQFQHKQHDLHHLAQLQLHPDQLAAFNQAVGLLEGTKVKVTEVDTFYPNKIQYVKSPTDIEWNRPLDEQLEPQRSGEPSSKKSFDELRALRKRVPKLDNATFKAIFPGKEQSRITVVNKTTFAHHYVNLQEAAAWILNGFQWFTILEQPMLNAVWTQDWPDAAKFQYLMQILQSDLEDYIPKWQIFVESDSEIQKPTLKWRSPSTLWIGQPVIGFTTSKIVQKWDLQTSIHCGPFTSVSSNYENITFGMDTSHILSNLPHPKDALISPSLIVVFKAAIAYSSSKSGNHSQSHSSSVFRHKGREEGSNLLLSNMEVCLRVRHSSRVQ